jgi:histidinol-phosphate phosphatase family protein
MVPSASGSSRAVFDRSDPAVEYAIVVPTIGRQSLNRCLAALARASGPRPARLVLVDDRPHTPEPLNVDIPAALAGVTATIMTSGGRGPAAARNAGARVAGAAPWVVFLDDDVEVGPRWAEQLAGDLAAAGPGVGGVQGRLRVPMPASRRPTDWERGTRGLEQARWATADMAYRRDALVEAGGFDERFRRAFREDADLALRVMRAGWELRRGQRVTLHPVRPADPWVSLRMQAGNADDVLMGKLHGRGWRRRAGAPRGRRREHIATTTLAAAAALAGVAGCRRTAAAALAAWIAATGEFCAARVRPGPRTARELTTMAVTSAGIPPLATAQWLRGQWRYRRPVSPWPAPPKAVLFDRDGTLVHDVPYNGDPRLARPVPAAYEAVRMLRDRGLRLAVVSNQSGVAHGLITAAGVDRVNEQIDAMLGPFTAWEVCPHRAEDGCGCRKPAPGLIQRAARKLGVRPDQCVVIGDTAADVGAARAAGARSILVPNYRTDPAEFAGARLAADLASAARLIVDGRL